MDFKVSEIYYDARRLSLVYLESTQTDSDGCVKGNFITLRTNFKYRTLISGETKFREPADADYIQFLEDKLTKFDLGKTYLCISEDGIFMAEYDGEYISLNPEEAIKLKEILNKEIE